MRSPALFISAIGEIASAYVVIGVSNRVKCMRSGALLNNEHPQHDPMGRGGGGKYEQNVEGAHCRSWDCHPQHGPMGRGGGGKFGWYVKTSRQGLGAQLQGENDA